MATLIIISSPHNSSFIALVSSSTFDYFAVLLLYESSFSIFLAEDSDAASPLASTSPPPLFFFFEKTATVLLYMIVDILKYCLPCSNTHRCLLLAVSPSSSRSCSSSTIDRTLTKECLAVQWPQSVILLGVLLYVEVIFHPLSRKKQPSHDRFETFGGR
jgi:hypothetical protein